MGKVLLYKKTVDRDFVDSLKPLIYKGFEDWRGLNKSYFSDSGSSEPRISRADRPRSRATEGFLRRCHRTNLEKTALNMDFSSRF